MKKNKDGGVILLKDTSTNETLVADIYHDSETGERMYHEWIGDGMRVFMGDRQKYIDVAVYDYNIGEVDSLHKKSDKHIGFLMSNLVPERHVSLSEWYYARSREPDLPLDELGSFIDEHRDGYRQFYWKTKGLRSILDESRPLMEGEFCHARRIFSLRGNITFMGRDKIRNNEDVAWLFRQLEQKGMEHSFAVLANGDRSVVLQLGIGDLTQTIVDVGALLVAADRFKADRIWFVHNHPSGNIKASVQDVRMWDSLKNVFNERLQDGIILNTNTGHYGVFSSDGTDRMYFDEEEQREVCDIPVLQFDKLVFEHEFDRQRICSSRDVARVLSSFRFGKQPKMGILVLNKDLEVMGNILVQSSLNDLNKVAVEVVSKATPMGMGLIIYSKKIDEEKLNRLIPLIKDKSCGRLHVIDAVSVQGPHSYCSLADEGKLCAGAEPLTVPRQVVDIIPMKDGRGIIRVQNEGEYLPGEIIRRSELHQFEQGKLTKEDLAERYFPEIYRTDSEARQRSFSR